ncbi:MarR family winged helix-turn-helix transcriptional regulator [Aurantimonas sp. VKM B-3413]|uniref:MarR family winged helix-turn-helix transcriptional regulator n=1 Tax=Aurantimonas sp. VKM B-3413 TaxID=2779401 RepID=UPI001E56A532|nr:MarR family winged helix-turn-helix transcriptional regulator [Aurantimonas sp. VKM B-3413]MCB8837290.1 MarR family winged helix-turn-helix transcriptional regulator [Aurantimonas sp. VKM B-3413]
MNSMTHAPMMEAGSADGAMSLVPSLLCISKTTRAFNALTLAEIGLHPGQDRLLDQLEVDHPVSVSGLADALGVRPSTVSKMLDRLVERGLVERVPSRSDARQTMVRLLPEGLKAQEAVRNIWKRMEDYLVGAISDDELAAISAALQRTDSVLTTRLRRLR